MPPTPENSVLPSSRKRRHLEEDDPAIWTRHPKLYMQEGTIVLLAGDTVFRTYSGILSMHSEVFSGMSSLSAHQPPDAEMYDGCPLVRLSDSAEDLGYFLEGLIDISFFPAETEPVPFLVVAGILRLATKYMVYPLRKRAIAHLSRAYTMEYDGLKDGPSLGMFGSPDDTPHPFEVIPLLREFRVEKLLPRAFYDACNKGFQALVNGDKVGEDVIRLSPEDARVVLLGWECLHGQILCANIRIGLASQDRRCDVQQSRCADGRRTALEGILYGIATTPRVSLNFFGPRKHLVCIPCGAAWNEPYEKEMRKLWDRLPGYFGLPDWTVLRQED